MSLKITFLHPDLGIGGAERLIVDAALALKSRGHQVTVLTAHHDKKHCFPETTNGNLTVVAAGDWLPRSLFGRCQALFASVRMVYITLYMMMCISTDFAIVDQVSTPLLLLHFWRIPNLFYCHFPDLLLSQGRKGLKGFYRLPLDWLEETTTGMADLILVNSGFTQEVFQSTFKRLNTRPRILYPSLPIESFHGEGVEPRELVEYAEKGDKREIFLSINRYERKKNIDLAIYAFSKLSDADRSKSRLVIAGGYDDRVAENVEHFAELVQVARALNLTTNVPERQGQPTDSLTPPQVTFLKSPSNSEKLWLLRNAVCLLYTPTGEHFGIVPVEAMYCETPVIAVNSGGPRETIVDAVTGWLRQPTSKDFADAMSQVLLHRDQLHQVGKAGRQRVLENFSYAAFATSLEEAVMDVMTEYCSPRGRRRKGCSLVAAAALGFHFCLALAVLYHMVFGVEFP